MAFVQLSKVSLSFQDRDILKDVTIVLTNGTKAALTGTNGAGKSTLMKIIAGIMQYDEGDISLEKGTTVAYLPQSGIVHKQNTLYEETEKAFFKVQALLNELESIGNMLAEEKDKNEINRLTEMFYQIQNSIEESGWYRRTSLIEEVLFGLGFLKHDLQRNTEEFSGGWQMRIALAKLLLQGADIIILDEPTNYLDLEARNWLTNYLKNFTGGFLLVSHDRSFLDNCVTETYELFNGKLTKYSGTYTKYETLRQLELQEILKRYEQQQEEIKRTEDFIRRFRYNKSKAAMVQDRMRRLEKLELIEIPEQFKKIKFRFPPAPHTGNIIVKLTNITKAFGKKEVIKDFDFILEKGERLVLVGKNGAGKTTLLKLMSGTDNDYRGEVSFGAGVDIGYFSQDAAELLTGNIRIIDLLENEAPTDLIPQLRGMLGAFLFRGDDIYKSISVLSGGEKSRLSLLRLLLRNHNLLILDEPTNHLDMHSQDALLDALKMFEGTIIFVSHDKDFIQKLATHVLELTPPDESQFLLPSTIKNFPGSYDYYLYTTQAHTIHQVENKDSNKTTSAENKTLLYSEQKELKAKRQKLLREEKILLQQIEDTELKLSEAQNKFSDPTIYSNEAKSKLLANEIESLQDLLEKLTTKWESIFQSI